MSRPKIEGRVSAIIGGIISLIFGIISLLMGFKQYVRFILGHISFAIALSDIVGYPSLVVGIISILSVVLSFKFPKTCGVVVIVGGVILVVVACIMSAIYLNTIRYHVFLGIRTWEGWWRGGIIEEFLFYGGIAALHIFGGFRMVFTARSPPKKSE